ncbi:TPA: conjugal transfer protein, partial [Streptococcus suis]|nr:conjugal transfer protein [Streptococcus suis]
MNALLFDERPIVANPVLAREIGLNEAIVLQQINFWLEINKQNGKNYHDGKYWTYNSIRAWHESDFSYLSYETVKRTFSKLEKAGYLFTGNYNKDPRDKTKWYSLNYDKIFTLEEEVKQKRNNVASKVLEKADENDVTNALGQNDPMEKFKLIQCNNSERTNGLVQTEPMQSVNMSQPLPNNTSNNTTDNTSFYINQSIEEEDELEKLKKQVQYDLLKESGCVEK